MYRYRTHSHFNRIANQHLAWYEVSEVEVKHKEKVRYLKKYPFETKREMCYKVSENQSGIPLAAQHAKLRSTSRKRV